MVYPTRGHPAKGQSSLGNVSSVSSQLSLFQKVQSDFLGLNKIATFEELLEVCVTFSLAKLQTFIPWAKPELLI